jgi:hypothetical protein
MVLRNWVALRTLRDRGDGNGVVIGVNIEDLYRKSGGKL